MNCFASFGFAFFRNVIPVLLLASSLHAEPHRLLGDGGASFWQKANVIFHQIAPLNGGQRLIVTWSEGVNAQSNRQVYLQILDRQGNRAYDPPLMLSAADEIVVSSSSDMDEDGNYFVCWISYSPEDSTLGTLSAQKFDAAGRGMWGEEGYDIMDLRLNLTRPGIVYGGVPEIMEFAIADERGGCYYLTRHGYFAIGEEGTLRREWEWHNQAMGPDTVLEGAFADGMGGFWCKEVVRLDGGDHVFGLNHYTYEGERLKENIEPLVPEGLPEGMRCEILPCTVRGGLVASIYGNDFSGFTLLDSVGNFRGEEFINRFSERMTSLIHPQKLRENDFCFYTAYRSMDGLTIYRLNRFDTAANSLYWGDDGIELLTLDDESDTSLWIANYIETPNGELMVPLNISNYREHQITTTLNLYIDDGQEIWGGIDVEGLRLVRFAAPTEDGGFWLMGDYENSGYYHTPPYYMNCFDEEGESWVEGSMNTGAGANTFIEIKSIWPDDDQNYHILASDNVSLMHITVDLEGNVSQNSPDTTAVLSEGMGSPSVVHTNGVTYLAYYQFDDESARGIVIIQAVNVDGQIAWERRVENDRFNLNASILLKQSPDNRLLILSILGQGLQGWSRIICFEAATGENLWMRTPGELTHGTGHDLIVGENRIFHIQLRNTYYTEVHAFNYAGERVESFEPIRISPSQGDVFGGVADQEDGLWLGIRKFSQQDGLDLWAYHISRRGEPLDTLLLFHAPADAILPTPSTEDVDLIKVDQMNWLVPSESFEDRILPTVVPIQIFDDGGNRLFDETGLSLAYPEAAELRLIRATPCGNGTQYFTWSFYQDDRVCTRSILLDERGNLMEGWPEEGIESADGFSSWNMFTTNLYGRDLAIGLNNNSYILQHLSNMPRQAVELEESTSPNRFEFVSISPNPFNGMTKVNFRLYRPDNISLHIFDLHARTVFEKRMSADAGMGSIIIEMNDLSTGLYFARLEAEGIAYTRSLLLLR